MEKISLAPWLIEVSYKYYQAANILKNERNLLSVAEVNAALSIEILLKSFLVEPKENIGTVYEKYTYKKPKDTDPHNLYTLYEQLPTRVKNEIFDAETINWLKTYPDKFTKLRYPYEPSAYKSASSILISVAGELIPKAIEFYRKNNCNDPWINSYPNI